MAQHDIPTGSKKDEEIEILQVNIEGQMQSNASAKSWLSQVKKTFNPPHKMWRVSTKVCIYRVPKCIKINKPEHYRPFNISFGPYHHQKDPQLMMDQYKLEAIHRILARLEIGVTSLIVEVQKLESEIRECYSEPIAWDGETLSWMLTMDACFILEFFKSIARDRNKSDINNFSLVFQSGDINNSIFLDIFNDIIKLENQIPLCVLRTLLKLEFQTSEKAKEKLAELLNDISLVRGDPFNLSLSSVDNGKRLKKLIQRDPPPCHLLDLYRKVVTDLLTSPASVECCDSHGAENMNSDPKRSGWWRNVGLPGCMQQLSSANDSSSSPSSQSTSQSSDDSRSTPCVQLLQAAGIKFQPGKLGFEQKRFRSSTLYLPQIYVHDDTEIRLRNLMAYEECQRASWSPEEAAISQYAYLFDDLIESEKDVSILKTSQIIVSLATSDNEIAHMFNHMQHGIIFSPNNEIEAVMTKVRKHYRSQWKVLLSQFKAEYFSKPWYVVSLVAAILILGMTAVQTVYTVKK